jgi:hypothetical protein
MKTSCHKCGHAMERGYVLDAMHGGGNRVEHWAEGHPEASFWFGLKLKGRRVMTVTTWRCTGCGLLESYANAK